jgi:hypothetical protein
MKYLNKKIPIIIIFLLFLFLGGNSVFSQEDETVESKKPETAEQANIKKMLAKMKKKIRKLEKSIQKLIVFKKGKKTKDILIIPLDAGIKREYGRRDKFLLEQFAEIKFSGDKISSIIFTELVYNLVTNTEITTKRITKSNFASDNYDELELAQIKDFEIQKGVTIAYTLKKFGTFDSRKKLLFMYRDFLTKLEFRLQSKKLRVEREADYSLSDMLK